MSAAWEFGYVPISQTSAEWAADTETILLPGEVGWDTTAEAYKRGSGRFVDGVHVGGLPWADLPWQPKPGDNLGGAVFDNAKTIVKSATQTHLGGTGTSTALFDDAELFAPLQPNGVYQFEFDLIVTVSPSTDIKFAIGIPSGQIWASAWGVPLTTSGQTPATSTTAATVAVSNVTVSVITSSDQVIEFGGAGLSVPYPIPVVGVVAVGSSGGLLQLRWSQVAQGTTGNVTSVMADSTLLIRDFTP